MKQFRMAIPFDELEANIKNEERSTRRNRYSRTPTYISEQDADARAAIGMMVVASMAVFAVMLSLWLVFANKAEAKQGAIYAKSELTKAQVKALNVMPAKPEKRHASH